MTGIFNGIMNLSLPLFLNSRNKIQMLANCKFYFKTTSERTILVKNRCAVARVSKGLRNARNERKEAYVAYLKNLKLEIETKIIKK